MVKNYFNGLKDKFYSIKETELKKWKAYNSKDLETKTSYSSAIGFGITSATLSGLFTAIGFNQLADGNEIENALPYFAISLFLIPCALKEFGSAKSIMDSWIKETDLNQKELSDKLE